MSTQYNSNLETMQGLYLTIWRAINPFASTQADGVVSSRSSSSRKGGEILPQIEQSQPTNTNADDISAGCTCQPKRLDRLE
jgi:hypothetical protein